MRNALLGYTYQHYVATLFISIMDVEREIDKIVLEANVEHKFDDLHILFGKDEYFLQIKDIDNLDIGKLTVKDGQISIDGKLHKLSSSANIIFFKEINFSSTCNILGFDAVEIDGVFIVSMSRSDIEHKIDSLYREDFRRKSVIGQFVSDQLDKRIFEFIRHNLPALSFFSTKLTEASVLVSRKILDVENILLIEGKPGVGKSHFVSYLQKQSANNITYRFWISNQDREYQDRLKYRSFINDLCKQAFYDLKQHSKEELIAKLASDSRIVIIDGLDHVENYNQADLEKFISFIETLSMHSKTIVLSRPLHRGLTWKKQLLGNWNIEETRQVLHELYHIDTYIYAEKIYRGSAGYPILVRYLTEQFKKDGKLPETETFDTLDSYYGDLLKTERGKHALAVFLCCRSFVMHSEIELFLDPYSTAFVREFISDRPYLFELRLNRISLFHDSFITYLRKTGIGYDIVQERVNDAVFRSLMNGEKRYQSRISYFNLPSDALNSVVKYYSDMDVFQSQVKDAVDFEAVQSFYLQLRDSLEYLSASDLEVTNYYDLSLILNIVVRDHVSTIHRFYYTYALALQQHDYTMEDITSSGYLFAMMFYLKNGDAALILNVVAKSHYDTMHFYERLEGELEGEREFFDCLNHPLRVEYIREALKDKTDFHFREKVSDILCDLFLHELNRREFSDLYNLALMYLDGAEHRAIIRLSIILDPSGAEEYRASGILSGFREQIFSLGLLPEENPYLKLSLGEYLESVKHTGSFGVWPGILSHLRLCIHRKRTTNITAISRYWTKYHMRKDYSFSTLDHALTVLEHKASFNWQASVDLIIRIQDISEKGYRGLLASYLMMHDPSFIFTVLQKFPLDDLIIQWFHLSSEYINVFTDRIYAVALSRLIYDNRFHGEIEYSDISNVLNSNRVQMFRNNLAAKGYRINVKSGDPGIADLKAYGFRFSETESNNSYTDRSSPLSNFEQGYLDHNNSFLIKDKALSPVQVAAFSDGNYSALADPELFSFFPPDEVRSQMREILHAALIGRSKFSGSSYSYLDLPGKILQILTDCDAEVDFGELCTSFRKFIELSGFTLHNDPY